MDDSREALLQALFATQAELQKLKDERFQGEWPVQIENERLKRELDASSAHIRELRAIDGLTKSDFEDIVGEVASELAFKAVDRLIKARGQ